MKEGEVTINKKEYLNLLNENKKLESQNEEITARIKNLNDQVIKKHTWEVSMFILSRIIFKVFQDLGFDNKHDYESIDLKGLDEMYEKYMQTDISVCWNRLTPESDRLWHEYKESFDVKIDLELKAEFKNAVLRVLDRAKEETGNFNKEDELKEVLKEALVTIINICPTYLKEDFKLIKIINTIEEVLKK